MEHLLLPRGATISADERAAYVAEAYDGGPFLDYPHRSRFKHLYDKILPSGGLPNSTVKIDDQEMREFETFVQTWLFFGLLHEVFGNDAPADAFVLKAAGDQQALITTAKLDGIINVWIEKHSDLGDAGKPLLERLSACILETSRVLSAIRNRPAFDTATLWVVSSLGETLADVILETLDKGTRNLGKWDHYNTDALRLGMIENGTCPSDVAIWRSNVLSFQLLYYLGKLEHPKIKDHSACVGKVCMANQYDSNNRPTVHRCADKLCGSFAVDDEKVMDALAAGGIALLDISVDGDNLDTIKIDVIPSSEEHQYVALSHVWVDGLGNPSGNELPRCQLAWVSRIMKDLSRQTGKAGLLLWLDTLCCPVRSLPHRLMCITRMRDIYRDASQVLVLDAALGHYNSEDMDSVELAARLMYSGWMRRLWTLQEGALARNLWVQLKDKAVDVDETAKELDRLYKTRFIHNPLLTQLYAQVRRLRETINPNLNKDPIGINTAVQSVDFRSVSVSTDEPLCLSTFLGLDQAIVVKAEPEARMAALWQVIGDADRPIAKYLLFFAGPRVPQKGFRWAPASFLGSVRFFNLRAPRYFDELGKIVPEGLRVQLGAIQVTLPEILTPDDKALWDDLLHELPSICYVRYDEHVWLFLIMVAKEHATPGVVLMDLLLRNGGRNVVLLEEGLDVLLPADGNDTTNGLIGHAPDLTLDAPIVYSAETTNVLRLPDRECIISEAAWKASQDPALRATIRPWKKVDEEPLYPDDPNLAKLPNSSLRRMQELADIALQDEKVSQFFPGAPEKRQQDFMGRIMLLLTGRVGFVEREWPSTQSWCVD